MGLFFKSKKVEDYMPIKEDIEDYISAKLNVLNQKLRNEYVFYRCNGSNVIDFVKGEHVIDPYMCIDITGACEEANWKRVAEFRGKLPALYQLSMSYKLYGAYYHVEEIQNSKEFKENCQLIPIRTPENSWIGYYAPEILNDVHNRLRQIAADVNQYVKIKYPDLNIFVTAEHHSSYSNEPYKIAFYKKEKGNPEQYREYFMDKLFDDALEWINRGNTLEDYFNFKESLVKEYNEKFSYKYKPKQYGLDLSFNVDDRLKHLQFKAEHGYYIPEDYYKLIPNNKANEIKEVVKNKSHKGKILKTVEIEKSDVNKTFKETKNITKDNKVATKVDNKIKNKEDKKYEPTPKKEKASNDDWIEKYAKKAARKKFQINPVIFQFLIPIAICFLVFMGYENGWFNASFISNLNNKLQFVGKYSKLVRKWIDAVEEWLDPALRELGTIANLLAFVAYLPLTILACIGATIWWLISWVIIAVIKLVLFILTYIIFIVPFLLYIGAVVINILLFDKEDDKDALTIISFILSLGFCICMAVSIVTRFFM